MALTQKARRTQVTYTVSQLVEDADIADCGVDTELAANTGDRHIVAAC